MHGKKDDLGSAARVAELSSDVDPAQFPKRNIEDDDVGSEPKIFSDDDVPVDDGGQNSIGSLLLQHLANMIKDGRIIVGEEDSHVRHEDPFAGRDY